MNFFEKYGGKHFGKRRGKHCETHCGKHCEKHPVLMKLTDALFYDAKHFYYK